MTTSAEEIQELKKLAPKLAKLMSSSTDAELMFAAMLDRARARDTTDLKTWWYNITTHGVAVFPENVQLFERLQKAGYGQFTGYQRQGRPIFRVQIEYEKFLAQLEKLAEKGAGSFIAGTGDQHPRFKWNYNIRHLAIAAQRPKDVENVVKLASRRKPAGPVPIIPPSTTLTPGGNTIALVVQKDGRQIRLEIPPTFSVEDKERLTQFVSTLPVNR